MFAISMRAPSMLFFKLSNYGDHIYPIEIKRWESAKNEAKR
jgi:hypothetical protein